MQGLPPQTLPSADRFLTASATTIKKLIKFAVIPSQISEKIMTKPTDTSLPDDPISISATTQTITTGSAEKSEIFTATCSAMKEENIIEGQRIVSSSDTLGKPQTVTAACEIMKDQIKDEARIILASPD
jgi:hypothetical protein